MKWPKIVKSCENSVPAQTKSLQTFCGSFERRRDFKFSSSNDCMYFKTDNIEIWSSEFHFYMAFRVVDILNRRELIKNL